MKMIEIKQACSNQTQLIEDLYILKVNQLANKGLKQWEHEDVMWRTMSQDYKIEQFYIVYRNQQPVGAFVLVDYDPTYWKDDEAGKFLYIHKVMVLDEAEKTGISGIVLDYFKEETYRRGYTIAKLDVRAYKDKLRAYYERNGFVLHRIVDLNKGYLTALYTWTKTE